MFSSVVFQEFYSWNHFSCLILFSNIKLTLETEPWRWNLFHGPSRNRKKPLIKNYENFYQDFRMIQTITRIIFNLQDQVSQREPNYSRGHSKISLNLKQRDHPSVPTLTHHYLFRLCPPSNFTYTRGPYQPKDRLYRARLKLTTALCPGWIKLLAESPRRNGPPMQGKLFPRAESSGRNGALV